MSSLDHRVFADEEVDPSPYHFRSTPIFEVGPEPYQWLNENAFISTGARRPDRVELKVFKVA